MKQIQTICKQVYTREAIQGLSVKFRIFAEQMFHHVSE